MKATPTKLRNGNWGARVVFDAAAALPPRENDIIAITTRSGKSWNARVERVLWTGDGVAICATASLDRPRRAHNGECSCGACDDLLSFGYSPGQRVRCRECGGWAEAY